MSARLTAFIQTILMKNFQKFLKHNSTLLSCVFRIFHNWYQSSSSKGLSTSLQLKEKVQHGRYATTSHSRRSLFLQVSHVSRRRRFSILERHDEDVSKVHTLSSMTSHYTGR